MGKGFRENRFMAPVIERLRVDVQSKLDEVSEADLALGHFQSRIDKISHSNMLWADKHLQSVERLLEEVEKAPSKGRFEEIIAKEIEKQISAADDAIKKAKEQKRDFDNSMFGRLTGYKKITDEDIKRLEQERNQLLEVPELIKFRAQLKADLGQSGILMTPEQLNDATRTKQLLQAHLEEENPATAQTLSYSMVKTKMLLENLLDKAGIEVQMEKVKDPNKIEDAFINWLDKVEQRYENAKSFMEEGTMPTEIESYIKQLDKMLFASPKKATPTTSKSSQVLMPSATPTIQKGGKKKFRRPMGRI